MRKIPKINLRKKRKFKNMINKQSVYKYNNTPFIYFNNNIVEIIKINGGNKK